MISFFSYFNLGKIVSRPVEHIGGAQNVILYSLFVRGLYFETVHED